MSDSFKLWLVTATLALGIVVNCFVCGAVFSLRYDFGRFVNSELHRPRPADVKYRFDSCVIQGWGEDQHYLMVAYDIYSQQVIPTERNREIVSKLKGKE